MVSGVCHFSEPNLSNPVCSAPILAVMTQLARLARNQALACFFECVHPLFWPVLLWQLRRASTHLTACRHKNAMVRIRWWGGVEIVILGQPEDDPSAYKPIPAAHLHWSHPVWSAAVPVTIIELATRAVPVPAGADRITSRCIRPDRVCPLPPAADTS